MPVYNSEKYVIDSIQSILNQSFSDFELIVVDDCSTDSSFSLVSGLEDSRIKLIKMPENSGISKALNKGIDVAKGEYIFRMDSDDISLPYRLEKQIKYMDENPSCALCGSWIKTFGYNEVLFDYDSSPEKIKSNLMFFNCIAHPSVVIRKKFIDDNNLFYEEDFPCAEDFYLWTKVSKLGEIHNIKEVLLMYRTHENQIGKTSRDIQRKSVLGIIKKQVSDFLGLLSGEDENACNSILNILISKENTKEEKLLLYNLFEKIINHNEVVKFFDNNSLVSTIDFLKKKGNI